MRAEHRVGELLKELQRASPQQRAAAGGIAKDALSKDETKHHESSPYAKALQ